MKKIMLVLFLILTLSLLLTLASEEFTYVGAAKCKICHQTEKQGKQHSIWEESTHSKSISALSSSEAPARAQEMGVDNPAESPECFKCHAPLHEKAPELKEEGITCEVCHGPGSAYKKLSIMKDQEEAVKNGLIVYGSPDAIRKQCLSCHENAHGKLFDFEAKWAKIKHPRPEKE